MGKEEKDEYLMKSEGNGKSTQPILAHEACSRNVLGTFPILKVNAMYCLLSSCVFEWSFSMCSRNIMGTQLICVILNLCVFDECLLRSLRLCLTGIYASS